MDATNQLKLNLEGIQKVLARICSYGAPFVSKLIFSLVINF